ncbi:MAG: 50S ribosomal protein L13 [Deltaproteobacteria bacterium]|nr:50S ribosomal protein L13 [Deltaproteobacteria bacterium]
MATRFAKPGEIERKWWVVDAEDVVLGRLATRVANVLRGKHKAAYTPHTDAGDFVIVVNASKVKLTGNKLNDKMYHWYSGYVGGLKSANARQMLDRRPEEVIEVAVKRMMNRTPLNRQLLTKLKVYAGPEHPHAVQNPQKLELDSKKQHTARA